MSRKKEVEQSFLEKKVKAIHDSRLPEEQKMALLKELGVLKEEQAQGMPFDVYAKIKNIPKTIQAGMKVYPKAKVIRLATIKEWDEIFSDF